MPLRVAASSTRLLVATPRLSVTLPTISCRSMSSSSSSSSSSSFSPFQWWENRQENKQAEKYKERVAYMANKPEWTLQDMKTELDEVVHSWSAKIPGWNHNKETAVAKKMHAIVSGLIQIMGAEATMERVEAMTRTEKLQAAAAGGATVEEVNHLMAQFGSTTVMHKVVRHYQQNGKALPQTPEATQILLQTQGQRFLSAAQKQKMVKQQTKSMMRKLRRR